MELSKAMFFTVVTGLLVVSAMSASILIKGLFPAHRAVHALVATVFGIFAVFLVIANPVYGTYGAAWWLVIAAVAGPPVLLAQLLLGGVTKRNVEGL